MALTMQSMSVHRHRRSASLGSGFHMVRIKNFFRDDHQINSGLNQLSEILEDLSDNEESDPNSKTESSGVSTKGSDWFGSLRQKNLKNRYFSRTDLRMSHRGASGGDGEESPLRRSSSLRVHSSDKPIVSNGVHSATCDGADVSPVCAESAQSSPAASGSSQNSSAASGSTRDSPAASESAQNSPVGAERSQNSTAASESAEISPEAASRLHSSSVASSTDSQGVIDITTSSIDSQSVIDITSSSIDSHSVIDLTEDSPVSAKVDSSTSVASPQSTNGRGGDNASPSAAVSTNGADHQAGASGENWSKTAFTKKSYAEDGDDINKRRVFVGNLGDRVNHRSLEEFLSKFGDIVNIHIVRDYKTRRPKGNGYGFVTFGSVEAAERAKAARRVELYFGRQLIRIFAAENKSRGQTGQSDGESHENGHGPRENEGEGDSGKETTESANDSNKEVSDSGKDTSGSEVTGDQNRPKKEGEDLKPKVPEFEMAVINPEYVENVIDDVVDGSTISINHLNDYCLCIIFKRFPLKERIRLERVCKRWFVVSRKTWQSERSFDFLKCNFSVFSNNVITHSILRSLFSRFRGNLTSLDLSTVSHGNRFSYKLCDIIGRFCPNLQYLDLTGVPVTPPEFKFLTSKCKKIRSFTAQNCYELNEKSFWWLFHSTPNLEYVDISGCHKLIGNCFFQLGPAMRVLKISNCSQLVPKGFELLGSKCRDLRVLHIDYCKTINGRSLQAVCSGVATRLQELHMSGNFPKVSLSDLEPTFYFIPNLEVLKISHNHMISDSLLSFICRKCPKLRVLDIDACDYNNKITDIGITSLSFLPSLTEVGLSYINHLTDVGLAAMASQLSLLQKLRMRGCPKVTDDGIESLIICCLNLEVLDLSGCRGITKRTIEVCGEGLKLRNPEGPYLMLTVGGTSIEENEIDFNFHPLLMINEVDFSERHLRPDAAELIELDFVHREEDDDDANGDLGEEFSADNDAINDFEQDPVVRDELEHFGADA